MKVIYNGPQPTRTVELGRGESIDVVRGKPFDVPAEVGKKLVRQRHYTAAAKRRPAKKAAPPVATKPPAPPANPDAGDGVQKGD